VLVLHGFTGCPQSMRPLANVFIEASFTVELPLLPGHGTAVEDMVGYQWGDWTAAAEIAYQKLAAATSSVIVAGLSMGGSLTLWLAQRHPEIKGIILVNPAVEADDFAPFVEGAKAALAAGQQYLPAVAGDIADPTSKELGYDRSPAAGLVSLIEGIRELKPSLSGIKAPILLLHSPQDHIIPPGSSDLLRQKLAGQVEYVPLERSFHVATIDFDGDEINRRAVAFAQRVCS
jgi:carboxylesterase